MTEKFEFLCWFLVELSSDKSRTRDKLISIEYKASMSYVENTNNQLGHFVAFLIIIKNRSVSLSNSHWWVYGGSSVLVVYTCIVCILFSSFMSAASNAFSERRFWTDSISKICFYMKLFDCVAVVVLCAEIKKAKKRRESKEIENARRCK